MTVSFDKRLAELDAYLQMLIEQNDKLVTKISSVSSNTEKNGLISVKRDLETLLSSVKHSIVLLQIAKISIKQQPEEITPPRSSQLGSSSSSTSSSRTASSLARELTKNTTKTAATASAKIHLVDKRSEASISDTNDDIINNFNVNSSNSEQYDNYDEEEDDDAFYDAPEQQQGQLNNSCLPASAQRTHRLAPSYINSNSEFDINTVIASAITETIMPDCNRNIISNINNSDPGVDGSIDWDALYDEEEEDLGNLENQGSVITHLISQLRIGMDLTKVVLPTFILERRSLLEMYADFFAHPDLFSSIPDYKTPKERMVQLVRWYLSAFHAGRKSSVAKKPYNPILGEIFICHWNLDDDSQDGKNIPLKQNIQKSKHPQIINRTNSSDSSASSNTDDIDKFIKQLDSSSLVFVAEQVSHHPPVSAFYAENIDKRITCCAHIYTKSKYHGLSVGVHNVGKGIINLLDHNESYVCTFPSAYGRNILGCPWIELGGQVKIECAKTGYSANIEFVTKPFYGGKKHRVAGEILGPDKSPFLYIDGEWNGVIHSKLPDSSDRQIFVDTANLPVATKQVRSINSQEPLESRNIWKQVTKALKVRDVNSATAAKSMIEQRQRDQLKDRMEKGLKWDTRYFEPTEDGWTYTKPLEKRVSPAGP